MRHAFMAITVLLLATSAMCQTDPPEPWQQPYTGADAAGPDVIGLWQFDAGAEGEDSSGNGHALVLRGDSGYVAEGKFGGGLESFPASTEHDVAQGAVAQDHDALSPAGAFTIEAWFKPRPEMYDQARAVIIDKKYYYYANDAPTANNDYCLYLSRAGENRVRVIAFLGYGDDSAQYTSSDVDVLPDEWYHVAFTYDGAGTGRFFLNGTRIGKTTHEGRGPVSPGVYGFAIGDRHGSTHVGFPGFIDQVRISSGVVPFFTGSLEIEAEPGARCAFVRMEEDISIPIIITNDAGKALTDVEAVICLSGVDDGELLISLPDLDVGGSYAIPVPIDTAMRPDSYGWDVDVSATGEDRDYAVEGTIPFHIVPRPLPNQMPVLMWGGGDFETLKEIGFTHKLVHLVDYGKVWEAGEPTEAMAAGQVDQYAKQLDEHLVNGVGGAVYVYPGRWLARNEKLLEEYVRVDRNGEPYDKDNICGNFEAAQEFAYNVGASVANSYGDFPGLQSSLIHSEIRDGTSLCFHDHDREAFREFAGYDIPTQAASKSGVRYSTLPDFPNNRVIPDDDPLLTFYRWFWKGGDGWNNLHTQTHNGLKSTGRDDLWTFFDPAVRVPSVWGSGGEVDVASQWTYSYPDPIKIGQATDELFAMADGQPGQQVMKMTQVIWYRTGTAPDLPEDEADYVQWEKDIPDARFITISPDHMREAFWSKISRPIRGIMYHGWGSLVDAGPGGYRYTHPQTKEVLGELTRTVVRPLGPTLLQVPDRKADVALLESFASQAFAGRGTHGWSQSWEADAHLVLQWAQLQPRIVYDETVLRDGLNDFKVLVMPGCDVLTEGVLKRIIEFQDNGGLIVADEDVCPAIMPDILLSAYKRTKKADEDKAALQAMAVALRSELDDFYQRHADSSNPEVVVRCRESGATDYLFAVNDSREFGNYVGQHGLVMEKGLPSSATLSINHAGGNVYDLLAHEAVVTQAQPGGIAFDADFGPGAGTVYMVTDQAIDRVQIEAPARIKRGGQADVSVRVLGDDRNPMSAVIPVRIDIVDPAGRLAEYSGHYGAAGGELSLTLDTAWPDLTGRWTVRATELASGRTAERRIRVTP